MHLPIRHILRETENEMSYGSGARGSALSELGRVRDKASWASWASWRDTLLSVLRAWNRHNVPKILAAIVMI
jgi:hypothetical protein